MWVKKESKPGMTGTPGNTFRSTTEAGVVAKSLHHSGREIPPGALVMFLYSAL